MQLNWAFILLAVASSTVALNANDLCGDSRDCASNCEGGRYHIVTNNGTTSFGCKLPTRERNHRVVVCLEQGATERVRMSKAHQRCQAVAGIGCRYVRGCGMIKDKVPEYQKSCTDAGGTFSNDDNRYTGDELRNAC